jgi:hypothetical protein
MPGKKRSKDENIHPIFRLRPHNRTNTATIKYVGTINENEKLGDEIVELDSPLHPDSDSVGKHAIPIKRIGEFEMVGRLYRCNIVGSHLVASRRYPMMFLNVHYDRPMVSGSLLQLFFSIDMNNDEKKTITNNAYYVNLKFTGTWYMHIDCDDEFVENYERFLTEMLEEDASILIYKSDKEEYVTIRTTYTEEEIMHWIENYVNTERVFYDYLMKDQTAEFKSLDKTRDYFVNLCTSDKFYKFLQLAMKCREIHRRKEHGIEESAHAYVVPTNVTKLVDIEKTLMDNDEIILDDL